MIISVSYTYRGYPFNNTDFHGPPATQGAFHVLRPVDFRRALSSFSAFTMEASKIDFNVCKFRHMLTNEIVFQFIPRSTFGVQLGCTLPWLITMNVKNYRCCKRNSKSQVYYYYYYFNYNYFMIILLIIIIIIIIYCRRNKQWTSPDLLQF